MHKMSSMLKGNDEIMNSEIYKIPRLSSSHALIRFISSQGAGRFLKFRQAATCIKDLATKLIATVCHLTLLCDI